MFFPDLLSWLKPSYLSDNFFHSVRVASRSCYNVSLHHLMSIVRWLSCLLLPSVQNAVSKSLWQIGAELYLYRTTQMCQNSKFLVHSHMFFFHSRILLNWKTMILERFSDLTWGPAHCTPLTRIVPRLLLLYSIPSIHNYRNVVIRTGSWTAAYVCFVYACCLYCCVNLPLVPFCMFASFACFDSVNLEGSCVAFESCNDTDWLLGVTRLT